MEGLGIPEELLELAEIRLGHRFRERELLREALLHSSYSYERGLPSDNERLEFLGDAVVNLLVSLSLYRRLPQADEGLLSQERSKAVCADRMASVARALGLHELVMLGNSLKGMRENLSDRVLASLFEALVGALYLDGGEEAASKLVELLLAG